MAVGYVCLYVKSNLNSWRFSKQWSWIDIRQDFQPSFKAVSGRYLVLYRPPSSALHLFPLFQEIIDKIDAENSEMYLLGDLNCDLLSQASNANTFELLDILTFTISHNI